VLVPLHAHLCGGRVWNASPRPCPNDSAVQLWSHGPARALIIVALAGPVL
jgi:hypothetical protein